MTGTEPAKKTLVGVDGSANAAAALAWAVEDAAVTGSHVDAVFVYAEPVMAYAAAGYVPPTQEEVDSCAKRALDIAMAKSQAGALAGAGGVKVGLRSHRGFPIEVLANLAGQDDTAKVVVGAGGHRLIEELTMGSVTKALIRLCPKPLIVVPPSWPVGDSSLQGRRIVVGLDGSAPSLRALGWAADEARARSVGVEVVTAWVPPEPVLSLHAPKAADQLQALTDRLGAWVSAVDTSGVEVTVSVHQGHPSQVLEETARDAQLIVVGRQDHGWLHRLFRGTPGRECAGDPATPVALVP